MKKETIRIPLRMTIVLDRAGGKRGDVVPVVEHVEYGEVPFDAVFERQRALMETIARSRGDRETAQRLSRELYEDDE